MGEAGPQGPQGPRGNDGQQGPAGIKGNQGKKGDKGVKGADGDNGVGIARIDQDSVDGSVVMYLTDGTSYTVEMPLIDSEGNLSQEVHYKSGGGGGGGIVDLSSYVRRPTDTHDGSWLVYREPNGSNQGEWSPATTDLIATNSSVVFRDSKGRFKSASDVPDLNNQLEVNRFLWNAIEGLLEEPEAPELPEDRLPIYAEDEPTEYPYAEDGEPNDLEVGDQWYQVEDPSFDYDNPDPEGLDLYLWTPTEDDATVFEWVLFVAEAPDGVVIIKDEAPDPEEDEVGNGSLWFDNSQDTMQLYVWHEDSDAWIPVAPPTTLEGRVSTGEATQQAIIAQITVALEEQEALRNRLAKALIKDANNEVTSDFRIKGDGGTYVSTAGDELGLYHVKYPTEAKHAASKEYVDSVAGGLDEAGNYYWTGHHQYSNGRVEFSNSGHVEFSGAKSDASGTNEKSWMQFKQNSNGDYWLHFGVNNTYWDNRWTLGSAKMTWAKNQDDDPLVQIDQHGLAVGGSPVTRNVTLLTALKSATSFEELKAHLIEALEAEEKGAEE
jgi:hypothetical protein